MADPTARAPSCLHWDIVLGKVLIPVSKRQQDGPPKASQNRLDSCMGGFVAADLLMFVWMTEFCLRFAFLDNMPTQELDYKKIELSSLSLSLSLSLSPILRGYLYLPKGTNQLGSSNWFRSLCHTKYSIDKMKHSKHYQFLIGWLHNLLSKWKKKIDSEKGQG